MSRALDGVVMRVMDGLMAIPDILLAIALMALFRASAPMCDRGAVPQVPRVARSCGPSPHHSRASVIEAAHSIGTRFRRILTSICCPIRSPH